MEEIMKAIKDAFGENSEYILKDQGMKSEIKHLTRLLENGSDPGNSRYAKENVIKYAKENIMTKAKYLNEHMLTPATAKIGDGATIHLWSDAHACTIVKVTKSTVTVRRDKAIRDPDFKPEWVVGGFAAHCTNQEDQKWTYEKDPEGEKSTFRWSRKYNSYGRPGFPTLTRGRHEYYDYNF